MQLKTFVTSNPSKVLLINFREFHRYQLVTLGGGLGDRGEVGGGGGGGWGWSTTVELTIPRKTKEKKRRRCQISEFRIDILKRYLNIQDYTALSDRICKYSERKSAWQNANPQLPLHSLITRRQ